MLVCACLCVLVCVSRVCLPPPHTYNDYAQLKKTPTTKQRIEVSASDIAWIKENISSMNIKIQEVNLSLVKLNQTVIGDKTYGQTGLIEKVEEHSSYIEKDKQFKSKLVGGGLVLAFIWGLILKLIK